MSKSTYVKFFFIFITLFKVIEVSAKVTSSFNGISLSDTSQSDYSFIVSGHLHGSSSNVSGFPASSLLGNIDTLNSSGSLLLISLGDIFLDVNENIIANYNKSFFNKLKLPIFNSVGNHDLSGKIYEEKYGKTFFYFTYNSELFIILNTELNDGSIKGEQMNLLKQALQTAKESQTIKSIFIFSHRPVWAENNSAYNSFFADNTKSEFGKNNYDTEVLPLINNFSKKVYWFSGSMGGMAPASFFYDYNKKSKVTYLCTAIRDLPRDAVLKVNVNNGNISFSGISFTNQKLNPIESYSINYWKKNAKKKQSFNFRLIPYLTLQMIKHFYFWIGFGLSMVLSIAFFYKLRSGSKWK